MTQKIKIFTNQVFPTWEPQDIETFLGGSEESIVLFAEELAKLNYDVTVYHSARVQSEKNHNKVQYSSRERARCDNQDIFITWKDRNPWLNKARGKINIHWTADIESSWGMNPQTHQLNIDSINSFVNISNYQSQKNIFVPQEKTKVCPLGVDIESLEANKQKQIPNTILYCSSPERGLLQLLQDWPQIRKHYPQLTLKVAYGWRHFNFQNFQLRRFRNNIDSLLKQPGIEYLGILRRDEIEKEYWKAQYWCLPLNNPDSELFCLNAVKARYCGAVPIVNKMGALKETVGDYIPYAHFKQGKDKIVKEKAVWSAMSWKDVINKYWEPILKEKFETVKDKNRLFDHLIVHSDVIAAKKLNDKHKLGKDDFLQKTFPIIYKKYTETKEIQDYVAQDGDNRNAFKFLGDHQRFMRMPRFLHLIHELQKLDSNSLILDYGCSVGEILVSLAHQLPLLSFEGADISPVKLKIGQEYIQKANISNVKFFECNNPSKITEGKYDAVICTETLEHILEYKEFLEGIEQSVKIGGKIFLTTPSGILEAISFNDPNMKIREHIHHFEYDDLMDIMGHKKDAKIIHIPDVPIQNIPIANYLWSWTRTEDNTIGSIDYERKFKTQSLL